jgi:hypothetical protein
MKSRIICLLLTLLLLLCPLSSCGQRSQPPALEQIYDEVVALVEASHTINDAVFGRGLPVYEIGSDYALKNDLYKESDYASYQYVSAASPYLSTGQIKDALLSVYSEEYVASLSTVLFDGFVMGSSIVRAQLSESSGQLMQSTDYEPLYTHHRIYDYSTMRIVKPSSAQYVTIELESHLEHEQTSMTVSLSLVLEEDGWRLDTPTF